MKRSHYRPSKFHLRQADSFSALDQIAFKSGPVSLLVERRGRKYEAVITFLRKPFAIAAGNTTVGAINALWPSIEMRLVKLDEYLDTIQAIKESAQKLQRLFAGSLPIASFDDELLPTIFVAVEDIKNQIRKQSF